MKENLRGEQRKCVAENMLRFFVQQFVTSHKCSEHQSLCHNVDCAKELADHQQGREKKAYIAAYPASKVSNVLVAVAGAEAPAAPCSYPCFSSSADMQYHLSKYLDNWI